MRKILPWLVASFVVSEAIAQPVQSFQTAPGTSSGAAVSSNSEIYFMVEQLRTEVQELRAVIEQHGFQIEQMKQQERDRYIDLDRRIVELGQRNHEGATAPSATTAVSVAAAVSESDAPTTKYRQPDAAEKEMYQKARDLIAQKKYEAAIDALYAFIQKYPEGDLTVNAYYWLGEVYLVIPKYEQARQAFTIVTSRFGDHRKAADAQFKLGVAYQREGNVAEAKKALQETISRYPGSSAASLAKSYLANL